MSCAKHEHGYRGQSEPGAAEGVQRRGRGSSRRATCQNFSESTIQQQLGLFDE